MRPPGPRTIEKVMLDLLAQRGTATACPSEVARRLAPTAWRELMDRVRDVAGRLQQRGLVDVYQRGRPVDIAEARGPIRLRARAVQSLDYRKHPELYVVGRGEQGVLTVEPYKSELLPLWRFKTPAMARTSAAALYRAFLAYGKRRDFVGMDMARKYLQMGWTRSRRYANRLDPVRAAEKAESAAIFKRYFDRAREHPTYRRLRATWPPTASSRSPRLKR